MNMHIKYIPLVASMSAALWFVSFLLASFELLVLPLSALACLQTHAHTHTHTHTHTHMCVCMYIYRYNKYII
jgi:hypothetical protein